MRSTTRARVLSFALGLVALGPGTAGAELFLSITDHNRYWGDAPLIPYEVTISNFDFLAPAPGVVLTAYVPVNTTYDPAANTDDWTCTGGGDDATCTLTLDLEAGQERLVLFVVRVNPATDPKWDLYAQVGVTADVAPQQPPFSRAVVAPFLLTSGDCTLYSTVQECQSASESREPPTGVECCVAFVYCTIDLGACFDDCSSVFYDEGPPGVVKRGKSYLDLLLLYRLRDFSFRQREGGRKAIALYYQHTGEIARAIIRDPALRDLGKQALIAWQPGLQALDEGQPATVSSQQVQALAAFLDALRPQAGKTLAGAIDRGRSRLQPETWAGIGMEDALARLDRLVCTREATGASIVCRIDDIGEVLETEAPEGDYTDKVVSSLGTARSTAVAADQLPAGRKRRAGFKKTSKRLAKVAKRVRSKKGRKTFTDAALRAKITDPIDLLRQDLKQLARQR